MVARLPSKQIVRVQISSLAPELRWSSSDNTYDNKMCLIVIIVPSYISSMTDFESVRPGAVPGGTAILDAIVPNLQQLTIQLHFILFKASSF